MAHRLHGLNRFTLLIRVICVPFVFIGNIFKKLLKKFRDTKTVGEMGLKKFRSIKKALEIRLKKFRSTKKVLEMLLNNFNLISEGSEMLLNNFRPVFH